MFSQCFTEHLFTSRRTYYGKLCGRRKNFSTLTEFLILYLKNYVVTKLCEAAAGYVSPEILRLFMGRLL